MYVPDYVQSPTTNSPAMHLPPTWKSQLAFRIKGQVSFRLIFVERCVDLTIADKGARDKGASTAQAGESSNIAVDGIC